MPKLV